MVGEVLVVFAVPESVMLSSAHARIFVGTGRSWKEPTDCGTDRACEWKVESGKRKAEGDRCFTLRSN